MGSKLPNAKKKTVKYLFLLIKESNMEAKAQMQDFEILKKSEMRDEGALAGRNIESYQYEEVMTELEFVKHELSLSFTRLMFWKRNRGWRRKLKPQVQKCYLI